jgi:hypothetical protein
MLSRYRFVSVNVGTAPHLLFGDRDREYLFRPIRLTDGERRDQHFSTRKPRTSLDDQIADTPRSVIEIQVLHMTNETVSRADSAILQILGSA